MGILDTRLKIMLAVSFLLLPIAIYVARKKVKFGPVLVPRETRMLGFSYKKITLPEISRSTAPAQMTSPIKIKYAPKKEFKADVGKKPKPLQVSTIYMSGSSKIAVINGMILSVGDMINNMTIYRIESDRVLIVRGKESRWLYMKVAQ